MNTLEFVKMFDPDERWYEAGHRLNRAGFYYDRVVEEESGCWRWKKAHNKAGYAVNSNESAVLGTTLVHRQLWQIFNSDSLDELQIDHTCRQRACVNPFHLEAVTPKENVKRALSFKDTCANGHPYTPENRIANGEWTRCKVCHNERERARYAAQTKE